MHTYNWGILGAGKVSAEFAKGLGLVNGAHHHSVYSRTYSKSLLFAQNFGFKSVAKDLAAFLSDPDLDIVYIATPNHLHHEHAIQCLNAGKHVLIEKPFALNFTQAKEIIDLAQQKQLFCMEGMWSRFMPVYQDVNKLLNTKKLGALKYLSASFGLPLKYNPKIRQFDLSAGGGSLLDLGIYPISISIMFLGIPESVSGYCTKAKSGVDSSAMLTLHYKDNLSVDIRCSFDYALPNNVWISGTNGCINILSPLYRPTQYATDYFAPLETTSFSEDDLKLSLLDHFYKNPFLSKLIQSTNRYFLTPLRDYTKKTKTGIVPNGYQYEALEVVKCLETGKLESNIMPLSHTLATLKITDELLDMWEIQYPTTKLETEN